MTTAAIHASALYKGRVTHRRLRPLRHRLTYRVFWLLLDLDEIDAASRRLRLFSRNRFNACSFHDRDHGDGSDRPLRQQIEAKLLKAGVAAVGSIRLLTMPRIFGYAFNPLSVYFCHRPDGRLRAIVYEVNNTFGQRHTYVAPIDDADGPIRQECAKRFYVSPFMEMAMRYVFRVVPPSAQVVVSISARDETGPVINAALVADRAPLSDASLAAACAAYPLLTLKVIAGIHWEALRMWFKGFRLYKRPPAPDRAMTVVGGDAQRRNA